MRKGIRSGIGLVIVLFALSHFFQSSFMAFDDAARESFRVIEAVALKSQLEIGKIP